MLTPLTPAFANAEAPAPAPVATPVSLKNLQLLAPVLEQAKLRGIGPVIMYQKADRHSVYDVIAFPEKNIDLVACSLRPERIFVLPHMKADISVQDLSERLRHADVVRTGPTNGMWDIKLLSRLTPVMELAPAVRKNGKPYLKTLEA